MIEDLIKGNLTKDNLDIIEIIRYQLSKSLEDHKIKKEEDIQILGIYIKLFNRSQDNNGRNFR